MTWSAGGQSGCTRFRVSLASSALPQLTADADHTRLPTGSGRDFLLDLLMLYYRVALVVVDGYLNQGPQPDAPQYANTSRELLNLVVGKWSSSLHMWPKLFLHSALIAALALPVEGGFHYLGQPRANARPPSPPRA